MKYLLLTLLALAVALGNPTFVQNPWTNSYFYKYGVTTFYVATPLNNDGVKFIERYIIERSSNIDSPFYGNYLNMDFICHKTRGDKFHYDRVTEWLTKYDIQCEITCDTLKCTGTIGSIDRAFKTRMGKVYNKFTGETRFHSRTPYHIPEDLKQSVVFVDGLCNKLPGLSLPKIRKTKYLNEKDGVIPDSGAVVREVLMRLYNISDTSTSTLVSVGAMEYQGGNGFSNTDLTQSQFANGVNGNPISDDHIIGQNNSPDTESELDVQVMYWAASDATLWYEDFSSSFGSWMFSWATNFLERKDYPQVISLSWGWNEVDQCSIATCTNETSKMYVERSNIEFMKITARGTTIVVASGDAGSPGRTNEGCDSTHGPFGWNQINAVFRGSSPWGLSVGATYVVAGNNTFHYKTPICTNTTGVKCAMGTSEAETTQLLTGWTSGAGSTRWTNTPEWQYNDVQKYLDKKVTFPNRKYFNPHGRFYPDVSALGHNCMTVIDGVWQGVDGTSCASPIFAGIVTKLNDFQRKRGRPLVGFVNPLLYKMYHEKQSTFNDITVGNSSCTEFSCCGKQFGFIATGGWGAVSGIGTPNVGNMMEYLEART